MCCIRTAAALASQKHLRVVVLASADGAGRGGRRSATSAGLDLAPRPCAAQQAVATIRKHLIGVFYSCVRVGAMEHWLAAHTAVA
eukprot:351603-Chlamydomonas_euryale.AAC.2